MAEISISIQISIQDNAVLLDLNNEFFSNCILFAKIFDFYDTVNHGVGR